METWEILSFDFYYLEYDEPRKRPDWYVDECPLQRLEAFAVGRQRRPRRATKPLTIPSTVQVTIWKLPLFLLFLKWTAMGFGTKQQQKRRCRSKRLPAVRVFLAFLDWIINKGRRRRYTWKHTRWMRYALDMRWRKQCSFRHVKGKKGKHEKKKTNELTRRYGAQYRGPTY